MDWDLNHYSALADSFQSEKRCVGEGAVAKPEHGPTAEKQNAAGATIGPGNQEEVDPYFSVLMAQFPL